MCKQLGSHWARTDAPTESIRHYGSGAEPEYWPEDLRPFAAPPWDVRAEAQRKEVL